MRMRRIYVASLGALLLATTVAAHVQRPGNYVSKPGFQEFTGQMIVRPLQPASLAKLGKGAFEQFVIRARAKARLDFDIAKYVEATDEYVIDLPPGHDENSYSAAMMATGDYQYVEPNWKCYPQLVPNDQRYGQQWHHVTVKSAEAWNYLTGSPTIISAVVDTGIDLTHPDLAPNRVPGFNSVDNLAEANGGQVNDLNGHGTHVAGDAAAIGNNTIGVAGMGWNFRIMMIRTSNSSGGGATIDQITGGARWAADNGAKSVSASYSGVDAAAVGTTGTYIKTKGALFLYAAGNDNRDLSGFSHPDTIVVGASSQTDQKASFSAYGRGVHVFAPGVNILSTTLGGGYGGASGTSMAAPVANGAVALIYAARPTLTPNQVQNILETSCDQIGPSTIFGFGRINQLKNMQKVFISNPVDSLPISISVYVGTHLAGTLNDILSPNTGGPSYDILSASVDRLGHAAGPEIGFDLDVAPSSLQYVEITVQSRVDRKVPVTAFVYGWDKTTNRFEPIFQFPVNTTAFTTHKYRVATNFARFFGSGGSVRLLVRGVGARVSGRLPASPFVFKVGHAKMTYQANQ